MRKLRLASRMVVGALAALPALAVIVVPTAMAGAQVPGRGYDVSYPQCSTRASSYPQRPAFGIVGVDRGLANEGNPCLGAGTGYASELVWAASSPGLYNQAPVSLYLNTADPGPGVPDWPAAGSGPQPCNHTWSTGCAYDYGYARAGYSFGVARSAASTAAADRMATTEPAADPWWIDVETTNTWATSSQTASWASVNIATLQGFVGGLEASGVSAAHVGFYSDAPQWGRITGLNAVTSSKYFSQSGPDWITGATTVAQAQGDCAPTNSFTGGPVTLSQYRSASFDADYRCPTT